jgi:hypothetical protein
MPNLNIAVSEELLRAVNHAALDAGETQKAWVTRVVKEAANEGEQVQSEVNGGDSDVRVREGVSVSGEEDGVQGGGVEREAEVAVGHEFRKCRVYGCGQCRAAGVMDSARGI